MAFGTTTLMRFSGLVLILLVTRQNQVDCQSDVQAFVGDTVTLPCFYNEANVIQGKASVMWMDKDANTLLVIVGAKTTKFMDRVDSFPHLYNEGNFSLVIKEVQQSDGGPYTCQIFKMSFTKRVSLTVSGRRVPPENPTLTRLPDGAASSPKSLAAIALSLSALFLFV